MFIDYPNLFQRRAAEKFLCLLYGIEEYAVKGIDNARESET